MADSWNFMNTLLTFNGAQNQMQSLLYALIPAVLCPQFFSASLVLNPLLPPSFYCLFSPYASEKRINDAGEERENVKRA